MSLASPDLGQLQPCFENKTRLLLAGARRGVVSWSGTDVPATDLRVAFYTAAAGAAGSGAGALLAFWYGDPGLVNVIVTDGPGVQLSLPDDAAYLMRSAACVDDLVSCLDLCVDLGLPHWLVDFALAVYRSQKSS